MIKTILRQLIESSARCTRDCFHVKAGCDVPSTFQVSEEMTPKWGERSIELSTSDVQKTIWLWIKGYLYSLQGKQNLRTRWNFVIFRDKKNNFSRKKCIPPRLLEYKTIFGRNTKGAFFYPQFWNRNAWCGMIGIIGIVCIKKNACRDARSWHE